MLLMRFVLVLLFLLSLVSTHAYTQETFECHVKNAPFQKVLDIIREQTGCTFFFKSETRLPYETVSMDEKKITVEDFLKKYLGVTAIDFTRDKKSYFIKRRQQTPFGAGLTSAPPQEVSSAEHKDAAEFKDEMLPGVTVVPISNGYQRIPRERATGSFGFIDRALITRTVSTSINDRIENTIPGLLSNHSQSAAGIPIRAMPQIRGLSTIYANAAPLYVLDNFPYDGDINNINPNDIEYITVLKDAAASSIWGVRAGNGVIVINTRKGRLGDSARSFRPSFSYSSSVTYQARPNMNNVSHMSSGDFIDWEKSLFREGGYYFPDITTPFTPAVSLMMDVQNKLIDSVAAYAMIESMKGQDVYRDISKYFYRSSVNQQHFFQASASNINAAYLFSAGWDHNIYGFSGSSYDRVTLRSQNIFKISKPLTVEAGINFVHNITRSNGNPGVNYQSSHGYKSFYPYARFTDAQGRPLPVSLDYSRDYLQGASQLGFPDWTYTPVEDMQAEQNNNKVHDLLINVGGRYVITPWLHAELKYQYENGGANGSDFHDASSYYTRDLINSFIQVDAGNKLTYPIQPGGILDLSTQETIAHQGRAQLNVNRNWNDRNYLNAIAGFEVKSLVSSVYYDREYQYDPDNGLSSSNINFAATYSPWQQFNPTHIPNHAPLAKQTDHFLGYYINASYTWHNQYTLSASAREDAANLFGVNTNNKFVPLLSGGVAWQINHAGFYHVDWLPTLKLRATYGRNGNISRLASAYTTATYAQGGVTGTPFTIGYIQGLANPNLRWERVGVFNLGLDFAIKKNITGSIEYYQKHATDLIGAVPGDPTLGLIQVPGQPGYYYANSATMNGSGIDVQLEAHILTGDAPSSLRWTSNFILSKAVSNVQTYLQPTSTGNSYLNQYAINPVPGRPVYAVYSYRYKGLDNTGDPMGSYNGKTIKDWASIYNNTIIDSMIYHGSSQPTVFGALRNTFEWRHFTASFNISYKFGYYFRRPSISYYDLFNHWTSHGDYALRWQHPGDETKTNIPAAGDPTNFARDKFYLNSNVLVEKADHIRLEDIVVSYDLEKKDHSWLPFEKVRIYNYLSNLGLLWKANKSGIDPYYINIPKDGRRYSIGININF